MRWELHVGCAWMVTVLTSGGTVAGSGASFEPLIYRDTSSLGSRALGVSPDGQYVVGYTVRQNAEFQAERMPTMWPMAGGFEYLGDLPGGRVWGEARAVSNGGTVVAGDSETDLHEPGAFRWTVNGGLQALGSAAVNGPEFFSEANALSADGSVIVGTTNVDGFARRQAFRWTESAGFEPLVLPSWSISSNGLGISDDGSTIVGSTDGYDGYTWTDALGFEPIGGTGARVTIGRDASADGLVVVGDGAGAAFRWSSVDGTLTSLGNGHAEAVSADGSVVVGFVATHDGAYIWDAHNGRRNLIDVLEDDYGLDMVGWELQRAMDISADGRTIVGWGTYTNPQGNSFQTAWVAVIPEPASASTLALTIVYGAGRRVRLNN